MRLPLLVFLSFTSTVLSSPIATRPRKAVTDLMFPLESSTALMCEPIFSSPNSTATWFKDGKVVAVVDSVTNAIYMNRPPVEKTSHQDMPQVGFLILNEISRDDEGEYWCRRNEEETDAGEIFNLRVAFVDELPESGQILLQPPNPVQGHPLYAFCPVPNAVPKPTVRWELDGEPITATSAEVFSFPNGTLFIKYISALHHGRLTCVVSNFAEFTSTSIDLRPVMETIIKEEFSLFKCGSVLRSSMLWFLIGCLVTSSCVLLYLLCVLLLLRPNSSRRFNLSPSNWLRSHPTLGPGFRKGIMPTPDLLIQPSGEQQA